MKIVVVTALVGPSESAPPPGPAEPGTRYVCYTDRDAPGWECLPPPISASPRYSARHAKTHVHELNAEYSIWLDASFDLLALPSEIVEAAEATHCHIAAFRHPDRDNFSAEAVEVMRLGLAPAAAVDRQVVAYRRAGFSGKPLTTTGLFVRRHSRGVAAFNDLWWHEITTHTLRDQLSVDFAAWRTGMRIGYLPGHYRSNRFARYQRERHRAGRVPA